MVSVREDWMVRPQVHYSSLVGAGRYTWIVGWIGGMCRPHGYMDLLGHGIFFSFLLLFSSITAGLCFQYHDVFMIAFHLSRFQYIHVRWWVVSTGKHLFSFIIFLFLHVTGWGHWSTQCFVYFPLLLGFSLYQAIVCFSFNWVFFSSIRALTRL